MELRFDKFDIAGTDGQRLVIYQAEPASTSEQALTLLASIAYDRTDTSVGNVNAI
ncbi:MAG: hypothetical protein QOE61_4924 [Micromonosporaceae bacterium]|nr:hypothetical protein [Micromonosporaceae bacterium]